MFIFVLFVICFSISSNTRAEVYYDQKFKVESEAYKEANRDGYDAIVEALKETSQFNRKNEIIVADFDSGFDYQDENFKRHLHVGKSEVIPNGKDDDGDGFIDNPSGYDFLGQDPYSSLALVDPGSSKRDIDSEVGVGVSHGYMTSQVILEHASDQLTLLPYRILPIGVNAQTDFEDYADDFFKNIKEAVVSARWQGARVVNMSLGFGADFFGVIDLSDGKKPKSKYDARLRAISKDMTHYLDKAASDIVFVIASGNESKDISSGMKVAPCQIRVGNVICVGSVNDNGIISEFSNVGQQFVDLYAVGEQFLLKNPMAWVQYGTNPTEIVDGTSFAAPVVSRTVARILEYQPCLKPLEVRDLLLDTADRKITKIKLGNSHIESYRYPVLNEDRAKARAKGLVSCR